MKLLILAAGKGIRMMPLTSDKPKPLIEINGKPFLLYLLNAALKAGYKEIGIIVNYKKEKIKEFLTKNKIKAQLIEQKEPKGTGNAIASAEKFINNEQFVVCGADNLWSYEDLARMNIQDGYSYIAATHSSQWQRYGVLEEKEKFLLRIHEKPTNYVSDLINTGLYKFTPEIFLALKRINPSARGEYEITDALQLLAEQKKVKVITIKDFWIDLGTPEDIPKISEFLKKNKIV